MKKHIVLQCRLKIKSLHPYTQYDRSNVGIYSRFKFKTIP